jgi:hypothetical protein
MAVHADMPHNWKQIMYTARIRRYVGDAMLCMKQLFAVSRTMQAGIKMAWWEHTKVYRSD